jgi:zinc protease
MRRLAPFLIGIALSPTVSAAQASPPRALDIGANATVWFQEDHTVPMVAVSASLPAGSVYDPSGKPGLAALAAYLLNEGAGNLRSTAYQDALARRAIQLTLSPDRDYFTFSFVSLSANAKDAFQLIGLALQRPRFDADAIVRVRAQMLQSLEQENEDPEAVASRRFYEAFFAGHAYAHEVGGTAQGLNAISATDLKAFAHAHWERGGAKIAVSGDIDAATLTVLLKSVFASLPAAPPPAPPRVSHLGSAGMTTVPMAVPQSVAFFGLPGMLRNDPDYLAGYVANQIVGGGDFSSRLTNEVREKRGLTYGISMSFGDFRAAGYVIGQVATKRESMNESLAVTREVLRKYAQEGPTEQELTDAKTYLTGSYPLMFSSNAGIASQLNTFQREGLPLDYVTRRNSLIDAVTLDDARRAARRLFNPARLTVVVAGSAGAPATTAAKPARPARPR